MGAKAVNGARVGIESGFPGGVSADAPPAEEKPIAALAPNLHQSPAVASQAGWLVFLIGRSGSALLVLWVAITLTFVALEVVPGNPLDMIVGPGASLSPAALAELRQEFGLDQSVAQRYLGYLSHLLRGDLGLSYHSKQPVSALIAGQVGSSALLTAAALAVAWFLALLSVLTTARRHPAIAAGGRTLEVVAAAIPDFWLGLVLATIFAFSLHWFPSAGGQSWSALVLPSLALGIPLAGFLAQIMRQAFDDALDQPFALSSRARGTRDIAVRVRHALRHAVLPGIALSNWAVGWLIGGSVAIERIFARHGLGTLILTAVSQRDFPVIMGVVILIAALYVLVNAVTDTVTFVLDPRVARRR
jgi:peptide/nickel transport system permease protein